MIKIITKDLASVFTTQNKSLTEMTVLWLLQLNTVVLMLAISSVLAALWELPENLSSH